jgi:GNAT superfamily N-acetyltransferase
MGTLMYFNYCKIVYSFKAILLNMLDYQIKRLDENEIEALATFLWIELDLTPVTTETEEQLVVLFRRHYPMYVACYGDLILGVTIGLDAGVRGIIHRLYVTPDHRGRGLGNALLDQVLDDFRKNPCISMVFARTYVEDLETRSFFINRGFRLSSRPDGDGIIDALTIDV